MRNPLRFQDSGGGRIEGSPPQEAAESAPLGVEGSVCRRGERYARMAGDEEPPEAVECGPGLACCYPCGIPGCDWICLPECPVGIP